MNRLDHTAVVLLAGGLSARFDKGDKLLANLNGRPVLSYAASLMPAANWRFAVTPTDTPERTACLEAHNWTVLHNHHPAHGQSQSLSMAIRAVEATAARSVIILLGDMPLITDNHLMQMLTLASGKDAVMSRGPEALMPPAIFTRPSFPALMALTGDKGARSVFETLSNTATLPLAENQALDIDTCADLTRASGGAHA